MELGTFDLLDLPHLEPLAQVQHFRHKSPLRAHSPKLLVPICSAPIQHPIRHQKISIISASRHLNALQILKSFHKLRSNQSQLIAMTKASINAKAACEDLTLFWQEHCMEFAHDYLGNRCVRFLEILHHFSDWFLHVVAYA